MIHFEGEHAEPDMALFVNSGAVWSMKPEVTAVLPAAVGKAAPVAAMIFELWAFCECERPGCAGFAAKADAAMIIGWEGMAATIAQARAWLEHLPVDIRDQAAAIEREALAAARKVYQAGPDA